MPSPSKLLLCSLTVVLGACAARAPAVQSPVASEAPRAPLETRVLDSSLALMPRAVTSFGAAALGGYVYAFGGYSGVPHAYSREGQSGELWRLDPKTRAFEQVATSEPTQGAQLVRAGDVLIRVGGMRARNAAGQAEDIVSLDEVASFAPGGSSWTPLPALPQPRSSHAAAVLGDTLYVVGGWKLAGRASQGTFADHALALDLKTRTYRTLPQPFALRALAAAPLDGKLVVVGGLDADAKVSRAVHMLDPATGSWSRATDLPSDGFGVAATSTGDVLYASARDGTVYALERPDGAWKAVGGLSFPRFFHQLVAIDGPRVLALGGISGMHMGPRIRAVEVLEPARSGPSVETFVLSNPLPARNRQGAFVYGDSLYVFGGNKSLGQHDFGPSDFASEGARLDLGALAWSPIAPLPVARQTMQTLVEDGEHPRALVLGGFGHDGSEAHAFGDAFLYDLESDRWTPDASALPTPRTQFGLTSHDGQRWVLGGMDFKTRAEGEAQFDQPVSVLRAAPAAPYTPSGVVLPRPRRAFAGALLDGRYYLVGGMEGSLVLVDTCDVLELASSRWTQVPCPKQKRVSGQLVALGGKLYLAGGSSPDATGRIAPNRSLEVFDPKTSRWSTLIEALPTEVRHLTMLPYEDGLILYSAHDDQGRVHLAFIRP